jgi:4-hydroxy-tetrahydrodipicolinate synthase
MGAKGWICVIANLLPKECANLYELAVLQRDTEGASKLYSELLPLCNLFEDTGMFAGLSKAGLDLLGETGGRPRRPMRSPSQSENEQLKLILKNLRKL